MVTSAEFYTHATFDDLMLPDTLVLGSHISKLHLLCKFLIKFKFVLVLHKWAQLLTNCLLWLWNVSSGNNWHISVLCRNFFFFSQRLFREFLKLCMKLIPIELYISDSHEEYESMERFVIDWPACWLSIVAKNLIFSDTTNVINVQLCMMVLLTELYPSMPLSVTLCIFQGHSVSNDFKWNFVGAL